MFFRLNIRCAAAFSSASSCRFFACATHHLACSIIGKKVVLPADAQETLAAAVNSFMPRGPSICAKEGRSGGSAEATAVGLAKDPVVMFVRATHGWRTHHARVEDLLHLDVGEDDEDEVDLSP